MTLRELLAILAIMAAATLLMLFALSSTAGADTWEWAPLPRMHVEVGNDQCFAFVAVLDRAGTYNETETLETAYGPVSVAYETQGLHDLPDTAEVVGLPQGVVALPPFTDLMPNELTRICLMKYLGG